MIRNLKRVVQEDISQSERRRGVNYSHDLLWVTPVQVVNQTTDITRGGKMEEAIAL